MTDEIKITNLTTQQSVVFRKENSPFILDDDGVDWGTNASDISTIAYPQRIGVDVSHKRIKGMRPINIDGWIVANIQRGTMSEGEWEQECLEWIERSTSYLSQVINPLSQLRVETDRYSIDCVATESLKVSTSYRDNNEVMKGISIALASPLGMFYLTKGNKFGDDYEIPLLEFPLELDDSKGYELSKITRGQIVEVQNVGDVSTGGIITITAQDGEVSGVKVINLTNGQSFYVACTIPKSCSLIVDTEQQRLLLSSNSPLYDPISIYKEWNYENDWIQFDVNNNYLVYECNGGKENATLLIECLSKFYTIRSA